MPLHDKPYRGQAQTDYNYHLKIRLELGKNFKSLVKFIRSEYLEIDLDKTSEMKLARALFDIAWVLCHEGTNVLDER